MSTGCIAGAVLVAAAIASAADSPPSHYSLKLNAVTTPEARTLGLFLKARIDGGPVLRLLLDSGAQHIMLDRRAAAKMGRTDGTALELVGVGARARDCKRAAPGTVQIGDLVLPDCDILVVDGQILEGVDGIVPMSLFAGFLVHLDAPAKVLELDAYPPDPPAQDASFLPVRTDNRLLFLQTVLNDSRAGYVLLDTGATFSAVSAEAARASRNYWSLSRTPSLSAAAPGASKGFRFRRCALPLRRASVLRRPGRGGGPLGLHAPSPVRYHGNSRLSRSP